MWEAEVFSGERRTFRHLLSFMEMILNCKKHTCILRWNFVFLWIRSWEHFCGISFLDFFSCLGFEEDKTNTWSKLIKKYIFFFTDNVNFSAQFLCKKCSRTFPINNVKVAWGSYKVNKVSDKRLNVRIWARKFQAFLLAEELSLSLQSFYFEFFKRSKKEN